MTVLTGSPIKDALSLCKKIKSVSKKTPIIWGGWHSSLFGKETLQDDTIDISVQGQGERTFAEIVRCLSLRLRMDNVLGICWKGDQGQIIENPKRSLLSMDDFNSPDYSLVDISRYFELKGKKQLDYISSIGCPFRCAFCADPFVYEQKWQGENAERVAENLATLWQTYQMEDVNFQDETFFVYRNRVEALAKALIKRELPISWAATLRADQGTRMPDDIWGLCKQSGLRRVLIGIESGSPEMIKKISKDTKVQQIIYCAEQCLKYDLSAHFSVIVGFPGETEAQVIQTLDLAEKINAMSKKFYTPIFYFKPYPGSRIAFDINADLPTSLSEWAKFDYIDDRKNPWITEAFIRAVDEFLSTSNPRL